MHLYTGKFDLTFTALQIPFLGICSGLFATGAWRGVSWTQPAVILGFGILGVVPLGLSLVFACRANRNARVALLAFLLKYIYATVMVGLGSIALLVGLITRPRQSDSTYLRDEADGLFEHLVKSPGVGAMLLRCIGRWNRRLIRPENVSEEAGKASTINSDVNESAHVLRDRE